MEDQADIVDNTADFRHQEASIRSCSCLEALQKENRLIGAEVSEEDQTLTALVLEKPAFSLMPVKNLYLGATLMYVNGMLVLHNTCKTRS